MRGIGPPLMALEDRYVLLEADLMGRLTTGPKRGALLAGGALGRRGRGVGVPDHTGDVVPRRTCTAGGDLRVRRRSACLRPVPGASGRSGLRHLMLLQRRRSI